ncbi:hypothetical protein RJ640_029737 [Escallonia rubra]|uniref:diacylglycerol kinase (ATP) n=1 Tax=Escallonia rubra TaxID=112253 RepID=A0AA88U8A5_9ASTE|nr:hypothetical protein RJ640_029737 [Escallonia rubra]
MVFINSKSGGHLGGELLMTYRSLLNKNQVVDLRENAPDKVLHQLYAQKSGDKMSFEIQKRLRLIVAGGDGTANWLLGVVSDLKLAQPPPVATEGRHTYRGGFWNYFSMGMDAEVSYAFLEQRKLHPERFKNQLVNQSTYAMIGCQQGLGASLFKPSSRASEPSILSQECSTACKSQDDEKTGPLGRCPHTPQHQGNPLPQFAQLFRWAQSMGNT